MSSYFSGPPALAPFPAFSSSAQRASNRSHFFEPPPPPLPPLDDDVLFFPSFLARCSRSRSSAASRSSRVVGECGICTNPSRGQDALYHWG